MRRRLRPIGKDDPMAQRIGAITDPHRGSQIRSDGVLLGDLALATLDVLFQYRIDPFQDRSFIPLGIFLETVKIRIEAVEFVP